MCQKYVRLSGEIADQPILNALRTRFPDALIAHAFASTEAGVGFAVNDGSEGFPAGIFSDSSSEVKLKVHDGRLKLRSAGNALRYLGESAPAIRDGDGFVDTGDIVEQRGERYYFLGRASGVINVGGSKVHPEEVEAVINQHPRVAMSLVRPRRNPIVGSIAIAEVVLKREGVPDDVQEDSHIRSEILKMCRARLSDFKVPGVINFVSTLAVGPTGKLIRHTPT